MKTIPFSRFCVRYHIGDLTVKKYCRHGYGMIENEDYIKSKDPGNHNYKWGLNVESIEKLLTIIGDSRRSSRQYAELRKI